MDQSHLAVLQAASRILNEQHPDGASVEILTAYANANVPGASDLAPDELATMVALDLMDIKGDPAKEKTE